MKDDEMGDVDCHAAFENLYAYLDGELTDETTAKIREHLRICAKCFSVFDFEKTFLNFVEARTRVQGAPDSVKRRVLESLLAQEEDESDR